MIQVIWNLTRKIYPYKQRKTLQLVNITLYPNDEVRLKSRKTLLFILVTLNDDEKDDSQRKLEDDSDTDSGVIYLLFFFFFF